MTAEEYEVFEELSRNIPESALEAAFADFKELMDKKGYSPQEAAVLVAVAYVLPQKE